MDKEIRNMKSDEEVCTCGDNVFREGVHLPGCPAYVTPQIQAQEPTVAMPAFLGEEALGAEQLRVAMSIVETVLIKNVLKVPPELAVQLPTIRGALAELIRARSLSRPCVGNKDFKEDMFALRAQIKETRIQTMLVIREHPVFLDQPSEVYPGRFGEMKANLKLAFRHLEDAQMRFGKAIQAFDGGKSCYER